MKQRFDSIDIFSTIHTFIICVFPADIAANVLQFWNMESSGSKLSALVIDKKDELWLLSKLFPFIFKR
jgi:hypothetical protein